MQGRINFRARHDKKITALEGLQKLKRTRTKGSTTSTVEDQGRAVILSPESFRGSKDPAALPNVHVADLLEQFRFAWVQRRR
jgi:hypothetical protein